MKSSISLMMLIFASVLCGEAAAHGLFDVKFDANGGFFQTQVASEFYYCEQTVGNEYSFPPYEPENPPFRFGGYWTDPVYGEKIDAYTIVNTNAVGQTLYARWLTDREVSVHFDANGGTVSPSWRVYKTGTTYFTLPVPTREHYDFVGWYTDNVYYWGDEIDVATKVIDGDHELYARWTPSRYRIRFHANNGTTRTKDQTFTYEEDVVLNRNYFTNGDFVFAGWARTPGGTALYGDGECIGRITALEDGIIHLYAVWSGPSYSVRFDSHGGEGRMDNQTFIMGQAQALSSCTFVRDGFEFVGWSRSTAGAPMFRDGAMVKDLSTIQNDTVVLYAVWKEPDSSPPGYCTVSADASSESPSAQGTVSMSVKGGLVRIGSSITLVAKASNSNSIFVHWLDEYGNVVGSSVTLKIKPQKSESYWAVFRGKTAAVKPEFTDGDVFVGGGNELKGTRYVKFSARVMTDYSWLPVRFSAKNLPDGLKINPQTGEISGVPTRTKTYRPVITVTSVANPKLYTRVTARITISSMPSWASRRLKGFVLGDDGCTVMGTGNIAATSRGKISGKFNIGGTNWVLSSSSFSYESKEGASVLDAKMVASGTATAKVGKKTFKMPWTWTVTPVYVRVDDGGCIARYTLSAVQGKCVFGSDERMTADLRYNSARYGFFDRWEGYYDWCEPSGGKIRIKMPGGYVSGKTSSGRSVSGVGQVLWDPGSYDDPDAELRLVFYNPPKTVKKKKWPSCGALLDLVNVPGVPVAGEYVAYRRQGVRAETDWTSTGTGSISYSPHNGQAVAGKTVTVKASPRSGSVFAYWLQDGEIVSYSSSYKVTMGDGDHTGLTAVFRLKSDFYYAPETPYIANESDGNPFDTLQVGVAFKARIDINEICRPVKFEAKNLPKGLSLNATTGVISGVPKSSGKKTISIKAKSVAKPKLKSGSLKIPVNVAKLDSWARGTFKAKGVMGTKSASLTLTVGKTGKISGKITVSKKSYSFSSASYSGKTGGETVSGAMYSNGSGQSRIIINGNANGAGTVYSGKAKVKYGSKKRPVELSVLRDAATGKTVVRVSVMDETKVYGYFATEYTSGNCMLNAITLKEKQTVKLVKEYDPEFNEVYDFGVRYYKIKLEKGTSCTIWIEGGNTRNMDLDVDTDWDDENAPFALFDNEEYSDGSVKAAYLHADSWDEDDPSYGTFYVLVSGDVGASAVLRYADGIKQLAPLGHYSRPVEISVPENTDWQSSDVFNVCSRDEFWFSAKIEPETGYEFRAEDEDGNALDIFIDDADGLRVLYDPSRRSFKVAAACNAVKFRIAVLGREYDTSFRLFSCRYCVECEPFEAIKPGLCSGFALHPTGE